jgi:hypothetical protein
VWVWGAQGYLIPGRLYGLGCCTAKSRAGNPHGGASVSTLRDPPLGEACPPRSPLRQNPQRTTFSILAVTRPVVDTGPRRAGPVGPAQLFSRLAHPRQRNYASATWPRAFLPALFSGLHLACWRFAPALWHWQFLLAGPTPGTVPGCRILLRRACLSWSACPAQYTPGRPGRTSCFRPGALRRNVPVVHRRESSRRAQRLRNMLRLALAPLARDVVLDFSVAGTVTFLRGEAPCRPGILAGSPMSEPRCRGTSNTVLPDTRPRTCILAGRAKTLEEGHPKTPHITRRL